MGSQLFFKTIFQKNVSPLMAYPYTSISFDRGQPLRFLYQKGHPISVWHLWDGPFENLVNYQIIK